MQSFRFRSLCFLAFVVRGKHSGPEWRRQNWHGNWKQLRLFDRCNTLSERLLREFNQTELAKNSLPLGSFHHLQFDLEGCLRIPCVQAHWSGFVQCSTSFCFIMHHEWQSLLQALSTSCMVSEIRSSFFIFSQERETSTEFRQGSLRTQHADCMDRRMTLELSKEAFQCLQESWLRTSGILTRKSQSDVMWQGTGWKYVSAKTWICCRHLAGTALCSYADTTVTARKAPNTAFPDGLTLSFSSVISLCCTQFLKSDFCNLLNVKYSLLLTLRHIYKQSSLLNQTWMTPLVDEIRQPCFWPHWVAGTKVVQIEKLLWRGNSPDLDR